MNEKRFHPDYPFPSSVLYPLSSARSPLFPSLNHLECSDLAPLIQFNQFSLDEFESQNLVYFKRVVPTPTYMRV